MKHKRIAKLAAMLTDEEIRASLLENDQNRVYIREWSDGSASVQIWNWVNGPMIVMDDDPVRVYAQLDYMRRHGYRVFASDAEVHAYAKAHGWPRKAK